jgi:hypothetical protein
MGCEYGDPLSVSLMGMDEGENQEHEKENRDKWTQALSCMDKQCQLNPTAKCIRAIATKTSSGILILTKIALEIYHNIFTISHLFTAPHLPLS